MVKKRAKCSRGRRFSIGKNRCQLVRQFRTVRERYGIKYYFGADDNFMNRRETAADYFEALARASQHSVDSIAILDGQFAALDGDGPGALKAVGSLDLKSLDPQDLYLTSLAFEAGGDAARAAAARKSIREQLELDLFNVVYFRMSEAKR